MRPPVDIARLRFMIASLQLWLADWIAWLAGICGKNALGATLRRRLGEELARAEDGMRGALVLMALQRAGGMPPEPKRRTYRPSGSPPGARRRQARGNPLRKVTKVLRLGGRTLAARLARLRAVAASADHWAARLVKRLRAPVAGLTLFDAAADAVAQLSSPAPRGRDTS